FANLAPGVPRVTGSKICKLALVKVRAPRPTGRVRQSERPDHGVIDLVDGHRVHGDVGDNAGATKVAAGLAHLPVLGGDHRRARCGGGGHSKLWYAYPNMKVC